jgi:hypothetical protein
MATRPARHGVGDAFHSGKSLAFSDRFAGCIVACNVGTRATSAGTTLVRG